MASNKKYKDAYYPVRTVTDMKDLINSSAELYGDHAAYLKKNVPGGKFVPVTYRQLKEDIDAFGTWASSERRAMSGLSAIRGLPMVPAWWCLSIKIFLRRS